MGKIEEALIKMGIKQQDVSIVLELVPKTLFNFEHNYNINDLKKMFETLTYINNTQEMRKTGVWIEDCPNQDSLDTLSTFKLIDQSKWNGVPVVKTTNDGEILSKAIVKQTLDLSALKELFSATPEIILFIIKNYEDTNDGKIFPLVYENNSYVEGGIPQNFLTSLPDYNKKCFDLCKAFFSKAIEKGGACIATYYQSQLKGNKHGDKYYVLYEETREAIHESIPKELENNLNGIKDNLFSLEFLFKYNPDTYNGLGKFSHIEKNILSYLKDLKNNIISSKDLFTSGFSSQMPYMIRDPDAYKTKVLKFEKELNKQISDLFSGVDVQKPSKKTEEGKKPTKQPPKTPDETQEHPNQEPEIPDKNTSGELKELKPILVGFECGTGKRIDITPAHLFISGVTQKAGKTTTLEALIHRSGFSAISFVTKPDEKCFENGHQHLPFFSEDVKWKELEGLFQSLLGGEKTTSLRAKIITLCKEEKLSSVLNKINDELNNEKVKQEDKLILIKTYIEDVFEQLENVDYTSELKLKDGINIMDLQNVGKELQSYIINGVLKEILNHRKDTIVIIPEAWKFIPQSGGSACKKSIEELIRQGASNHNFLWFDSQDIANVDKKILKSVFLWILGLQTETNEAQHTIKQIPLSKKKRPTEDIIMTLHIGEFFVCEGTNVNKTYVMPKWMEESKAQENAKGEQIFQK